MVQIHRIHEKSVDLSAAIKRHSADETVIYKTVAGEDIRLGLYYPPGYHNSKRYPVFAFIHGGGWASHKIFPDQTHWAGDHLGFLARHYAMQGFVSVSIDYRLLQERGQKEGYQLIDLYEDCADAVMYLKENADHYGLAFDRSVLLGESAGGYLAAALATFTYRQRPIFTKNILVNPITDLFDSRWNMSVPRCSNHEMLAGKTPAETALFLSPALQISDAVSSVILIHGTEDTVVHPRHVQAFYDEMRLHGRPCELHWIRDTGHAFLLAEYMLEKQGSLSAATRALEIIDCYVQDYRGNANGRKKNETV